MELHKFLAHANALPPSLVGMYTVCIVRRKSGNRILRIHIPNTSFMAQRTRTISHSILVSETTTASQTTPPHPHTHTHAFRVAYLIIRLRGRDYNDETNCWAPRTTTTDNAKEIIDGTEMVRVFFRSVLLPPFVILSKAASVQSNDV